MNRVTLIAIVGLAVFVGILIGVRITENHYHTQLEAYKAVCLPNRDNDLFKTFGCDKSDFYMERVENGWLKK